eukprot:CAMPEP_0117673992 /NCGR_PEP_ID=MMETSP0804-20121206/14787_1 /TAXON_ID=1074897 /ORGANISM="Tetraselmis astigmatica, Strain CCMP880" /LENGTH=168 /DNA_ID=CAMNT_0005482805 /DNA_START=78 /DNA_END=581 /DNA_ORIENTATION=-
MSSAFSFVKGRGMSVRETKVCAPSLVLTSKQPLRGLSGLISTVTEGALSFSSSSSLFARVLNAPQLLQASMTRRAPGSEVALCTAGLELAVDFASVEVALAFLAGGAAGFDGSAGVLAPAGARLVDREGREDGAGSAPAGRSAASRFRVDFPIVEPVVVSAREEGCGM